MGRILSPRTIRSQFFHARAEIKRDKLTGYKIRTASGLICEIDEYGRFSEWSQGEIPGDIAESILCDLL